MKYLFSFLFLFSLANLVFAQKESFDLTSYIPPKDAAGVSWEKDVTDNMTIYTFMNTSNKTWCRISILKSTKSKGNIEKDFESEWQGLIVKNYKPSLPPEINKVQDADGWKIKSGAVSFIFDNNNAMALMTTMSGFDRCVSIVATTNTQDYIKVITGFLESVDLQKPDKTLQPVIGNNNNTTSILGTWCISASDQSSYRVNNGVMSTIFRQYTFKANGLYNCNIKTFDPLLNSILLGRETGTYQISGNNLTINPQKSVLEEWSKKNGRDEWGSLLKTQNIQFEKITYQYNKIYVSEINEWQLILKASKQTKRDGPFNNYDRNAWIYIITSPSHPVIKLPN